MGGAATARWRAERQSRWERRCTPLGGVSGEQLKVRRAHHRADPHLTLVRVVLCQAITPVTTISQCTSRPRIAGCTSAVAVASP
jgi:hypothetical protein